MGQIAGRDVPASGFLSMQPTSISAAQTIPAGYKCVIFGPLSITAGGLTIEAGGYLCIVNNVVMTS